jgi:glycosyltransferase involved in cell wall biosynthesis
VRYVGPVDRVGEFLAQIDVFVAPLRAGGGMKVKISEALAWGRPIVTTPVGTQGFPGAENTDGMYVATDPQTLAGAAVDLLESARRRAAASAATRDYWRALPTWDDAARAIQELWDAAVLNYRSTAVWGETLR